MAERDIPTSFVLDPRLNASASPMTLRSSTHSPPAWTDHDDGLLRRATTMTVPGSGARLTWDEIVQVAFPGSGRTGFDCAHRWTELEAMREQAAARQPSRHATKGAWAAHEDQQLLALVEELGSDKWVAVGKRMVTRTGKQCRERYHNHLDPSSA